MENLLAIDPGREKCGLAILNTEQKCLERKIVPLKELGLQTMQLMSKFKISLIVIGGGTNSKAVQKELLKLDLSVNMIFVPEKNSTLDARKLYWKNNKPRGLMRLIPTSLRAPKGPVDDFAAQVLGERFLSSKK